jgi:hypothetical protein
VIDFSDAGEMKVRAMLIQMDGNAASLTPFGSLVRITPAKSAGAKSWTAKLRSALASLFR